MGAKEILRKAARLCLLASLAAGAAMADHDPPRRNWKKRWIASWVAVAAVNAVDIHSSRGYREANPLFRDAAGRFSPRKAAVVKSAIAGSFFATQLWLIRSQPKANLYKPFTLANSVLAGGLGGVAIRNYTLPPPRRPAPVGVPSHLAPETEAQ